jgi:hypothetical protein
MKKIYIERERERVRERLETRSHTNLIFAYCLQSWECPPNTHELKACPRILMGGGRTFKR